MLRAILLFQGLFYVITGLWPFLHLASFVAVVGAKPDVFQLHVTSGFIIVIGTVLLFGSYRHETSTSVVLLGVMSALVFVVFDIAYDPALSAIYWLDVVVEAAIAVLLIVGSRKRATEA